VSGATATEERPAAVVEPATATQGGGSGAGGTRVGTGVLGEPERRGVLDVVLSVGVVVGAIALFAAMFARLHYGADLFDESFYAALPYSFVLGHLPFVDEQHVIQTAGMLTWPLVKLYVAIVGDATGLMLFLREAWLVFVAVVAGFSFSTLRRLMRWELALLVALVPVAAVPFVIPSLSYNTMGSQLLVLGVVLGLRHVALDESRGWLYAGGVAHGLACVAYPTLAIGVIAFAIALPAIYRKATWRPLLAYLGGAATVAALLAGYFLWAGVGNVRAAFAYTASLSGYIGAGGAKLHRIFYGLKGVNGLVTVLRWPRIAIAAVILAVAFALVRFGRAWGRLLVPLAALPLLVATDFPPTVRSLGIIILFGVFAILLGPLVAWDDRSVRMWAWGAIPPLLAGFVTAYTSTNGFMNAGVGILPATLVFGALLVTATRPTGKLAVWLLAGVLAVTVGWLGYLQWRVVYHDSPWRVETAVVADGPYKGLHTNPQRAKDLATFLALVKSQQRPGDTVIFFNQWPHAYLFSTMKPETNAIWLSLSDDKLPVATNPTMAYFKRTGRLPTLAFVKRLQGDRLDIMPDNPLLKLFAEPRYVKVHDEHAVTVWRLVR
jgi:hypothetical protein